MSKKKGSRLERELLEMFFSTGRFAAGRIAGSGSTSFPAPDLVVGGMGRVLAIECKSGNGRRDINAEQIGELKIFSKVFGAEPWLGVRFDNMPWYFLKLEDVGKTSGKNYFVDKKTALGKGIGFDELIGKFKQKKL